MKVMGRRKTPKVYRKCASVGCRKKVSGNTQKCGGCRMKDSRKRDPVRYAYQNLKDNTKHRGIHFDLTIEQFREFCIEYDYIAGKGRSATSYTIDRIDVTQGYTVDNIQRLTKSENSRKRWLEYDWRTKQAKYTDGKSLDEFMREDLADGEDLPF